MKLLLATANPHKLREIRAILPADAPIEWVTLKNLEQHIPEPVEDQDTFEGNALLKARYYAERTGLACLADDSGLEVDALGGEPGIRSARYSGVNGPRDKVDAANNELILKKLSDTPAEQRTARFICAMALVLPPDSRPPTADSRLRQGFGGQARHEHVVRGTFEGRIIGPGESPRGSNGFGYDPLFYLPELDKTSAELPPDHKNRISHRAAAARHIWPAIQTYLK